MFLDLALTISLSTSQSHNAMKFYIIVDASPAFSQPHSTYKGLDRGMWRCVDDAYYGGRLPAELAELRKRSRSKFVGNLSVGTLASVEEAFQLAAISECNKTAVVLAVELVGNLNESEPAPFGESKCLGFDVYIDGYGSIISLGIGTRPDLFRDFSRQLNSHGLFATIKDIDTYLHVYSRVEELGNLEPLASSGPALIYEILEELSV